MVSFEPAARLLEGGQRRIATSRPPAGFSYLDFSSEAAAGGSVAGGSCRLLPPGIRGGLTGRSSNSRREVAARLARHGLPSRWQVKVRQLAASQPGGILTQPGGAARGRGEEPPGGTGGHLAPGKHGADAFLQTSLPAAAPQCKHCFMIVCPSRCTTL